MTHEAAVHDPSRRRSLVVGRFSFEELEATAADAMARDLVCEWLDRCRVVHDVAMAPPGGGVVWSVVDPATYDQLVFVGGSFGRSRAMVALLERFAHCQKIGINLTMLQEPDQDHPFRLLLERDSTRVVRPDVVFAARTEPVPVVGLVLRQHASENGDGMMHARANQAFHALLGERGPAVLPIDLRLGANTVASRTPAAVESLVARTDLVLTTRVQGLVLALKNCVPVVAIDPIRGGGRLQRHAAALGWPHVHPIESLEHVKLRDAYDACLTAEARTLAWKCRSRALEQVETVRETFMRFLETTDAHRSPSPPAIP